MPNKISRCNICGKFFDSKVELKRHKDKKHRISASNTKAGITELAALSSPKKTLYSGQIMTKLSKKRLGYDHEGQKYQT
jgi:uncharacterized Zn finger protein